MVILKYTQDIQKKLGAKTRAEPWMHIVFVPHETTDFNGKKLLTGHCAIYVWDTRQVLEEPDVDIDARSKGIFDAQVRDKFGNNVARDNYQPLQGAKDNDIKLAFASKDAKGAAARQKIIDEAKDIADDILNAARYDRSGDNRAWVKANRTMTPKLLRLLAKLGTTAADKVANDIKYAPTFDARYMALAEVMKLK